MGEANLMKICKKKWFSKVIDDNEISGMYMFTFTDHFDKEKTKKTKKPEIETAEQRKKKRKNPVIDISSVKS